MVDSAEIRRALVQKLESLKGSGLNAIPRPQMIPTAPSTPLSAAPSTHPPKVSASPSAPQIAASTSGELATPVKSSPPPTADPRPTAATGEQTSSVRVDSAVTIPAAAFAGSGVPVAERGPALRVLSEEVAACERCPELVKSRRQTVFGVGNPNARLVFFGEAPGADEDRVGEPFVGKAGQLLTKIIEACKMQRDDVYIMNVLRCRPPANRNPTLDEAANCRPFFERQFEIVRPEYIVCLGSVAATTLLQTQASVGRLRGRLHDWRGMKVLVTYHPAYLLRNASAKRHVWTDMKMLMQEMGIQL